MTRGQALCEDILREATAHTEPNINVIFARNRSLHTTFYDLFADSCDTFAERTKSAEPSAKLSALFENIRAKHKLLAAR